MSPSEIPLEQIERRDFSYVSATWRFMVAIDKHHPFGTSHINRKFIVGTPFKASARATALAYCVMRWGDPPPTKIHIYPRNYIQDARAMVAAGECVQGPEEN